VHAWVEGLVAPVDQPPKDAVKFTYNPYSAMKNPLVKRLPRATVAEQLAFSF
jgi:hypothetical protein